MYHLNPPVLGKWSCWQYGKKIAYTEKMVPDCALVDFKTLMNIVLHIRNAVMSWKEEARAMSQVGQSERDKWWVSGPPTKHA